MRMSQPAAESPTATKHDADRQNDETACQNLGCFIWCIVDFNGVSLFDGKSLNVTVDGEGSQFALSGANAIRAAGSQTGRRRTPCCSPL